MAYSPVLPTVFKKPPMQDKLTHPIRAFENTVRQNFSLATLLLFGASLQTLAIYLFRRSHYIALLSTLILLAKLAKTMLQTYNILPNPYLANVISGRTAAFLPDPETDAQSQSKDGKALLAPSARKIAVLHLGAKSSHPLGYFAPQFNEVGTWVTKMNDAMNTGEVRGFLGQTTFHRSDENGCPELVLISYWDSIEDLWEFAYAPLHKEAWSWWEKTIKSNGYVGINHEIFEAERGSWENVYVNFSPTLMGACTWVRRGKEMVEGGVGEEWVRPLVDARRGVLAKSSGRMGRQVSRFDPLRVAGKVYE